MISDYIRSLNVNQKTHINRYVKLKIQYICIYNSLSQKIPKYHSKQEKSTCLMILEILFKTFVLGIIKWTA